MSCRFSSRISQHNTNRHCITQWRFFSFSADTVGDVNRFRKNVERNALYSAFALIASPLITSTNLKGILDEEDVRLLFKKAYALEEELYQRRIRLEDILDDVLLEEFNIRLYLAPSGNVRMQEILREE